MVFSLCNLFRLLGCFFLLFSFQGSILVFTRCPLRFLPHRTACLYYHLFLGLSTSFFLFFSALSAFFSAVCFDAASPTLMVCSIYHIFFSLSILFFSFSSFCSILTLYFKQVELQSKKYGDAFILQWSTSS